MFTTSNENSSAYVKNAVILSPNQKMQSNQLCCWNLAKFRAPKDDGCNMSCLNVKKTKMKLIVAR